MLLRGPVAIYRLGAGLESCPSLSHAGLFAINELPLPACCEPGFCPSATIVSPRFTAMLYCMWLFFSGSLRHLSAHLVNAPSQFSRQQLPEHPAPLHHPHRSSPVKPALQKSSFHCLGVGCAPGPGYWDPCLPLNTPIGNFLNQMCYPQEISLSRIYTRMHATVTS